MEKTQAWYQGQVVECLPNQHKTLSLNPSTTKKKKKEILTNATTWMNLEDIMLSEVNQSQKDKYQESTYMSYAE
jgi:hypothetical protein